jgi:hypothetical protein
MKKWFALASLVLAAAVFAGTRTEKVRQAPAYFPCFFINNPYTCAAKSGGQCVWQDNACIPRP